MFFLKNVFQTLSNFCTTPKIFLVFVSFCFCVGLNDLNVTRVCEEDGDYCIPRIIWAVWIGGGIPEDVSEMINITKNSLKNFTYCLIDPRNLSDFLDTKTFPKRYFKPMEIQIRADFIRISLLEKYGGIWIDASTYVFSDGGVEWFISEAIKNKSQFITFEFNWCDMEIEFSFIGAPENSSLMKEFKAEFDIALKMGHKRYSRRTCHEMSSKNFTQTPQRCNPYFTVDLIFAYIVNFKNPAFKNQFLILPESLSNYRFFAACKYKANCYIRLLLYDPSVKLHPYVKIPQPLRFMIIRKKKGLPLSEGNNIKRGRMRYPWRVSRYGRYPLRQHYNFHRLRK